MERILKKVKHLPVIVEGVNDKNTLEKLGFEKVFVLSSKPLYAVCEEIAEEYKEVIILTDLDKKGKELYSRLAKQLQRLGVRLNNELRSYLFKETKLRQIEGLVNYINRINYINKKVAFSFQKLKWY